MISSRKVASSPRNRNMSMTTKTRDGATITGSSAQDIGDFSVDSFSNGLEIGSITKNRKLKQQERYLSSNMTQLEKIANYWQPTDRNRADTNKHTSAGPLRASNGS